MLPDRGRLTLVDSKTQTISALKVQKNNPNRVNVYLDGEFAFGLDRLVAAWLQPNQELTQEQIAELRQKDTLQKARSAALRLLSTRPRSEKELRSRLASKGFDEPCIERTLDSLKEQGLTGDETFAKEWVENRNTFRPRGRRLLAQELRQKGVDDETVRQILEELEPDEELAYRAAQAHLSHVSAQDWLTFRQKMGGYLVRRGFSYATASLTARRIWEERAEAVHTTQDFFKDNQHVEDIS